MSDEYKMDITRVSDDELVNMFEAVYEKQVAAYNDITSYECSCKRDSSTGDVKIEVMVVGMAGTPSLDQYKNSELKDAGTIVLEVEGRGLIKLNLVTDEMLVLNTNDYIAVYKVV